MKEYIQKNRWVIPLSIIALTVIYYFFIHATYSVLNNRASEVFWWMADSWNARNNLEHGYIVPVAFIIFVISGIKHASNEEASKGSIGILIFWFGILLYLISARTIQPRVALIGLPFMISGGIIYVLGWKKGKHFLFASFFWYFAMPVPGLNQVTNGLQVIITGWCYHAGLFCGMELTLSGNNIKSAVDAWPGFDIAEGCSGIKSLMALVMIAAIYAYYTQDKFWKKVVLFAMALPLALLGNFFRIFTILVIAEMGFVEFARDTYHDWAGLLIFFPVALSGLFLVDKLLNPKKVKLKKTIKQ
jgi:exosortase